MVEKQAGFILVSRAGVFELIQDVYIYLKTRFPCVRKLKEVSRNLADKIYFSSKTETYL